MEKSYITETLALIQRSNPELASLLDKQIGFVLIHQVEGLIAINPNLNVLVRTSQHRFLCPVSELTSRINAIEDNYNKIEIEKGKPAVLHGADYVRDVSLPVDDHQPLFQKV